MTEALCGLFMSQDFPILGLTRRSYAKSFRSIPFFSNLLLLFFGVPMDDALRHKLLRILEENPEVNQREISEILGISLGKVNYCLKALMDKGWIKAKNFKNSKNKLAYAYFLTPMGIEEKAIITVRYLKVKMQEYEQIRKEIEELKKEVGEE